MRKEKIVADVGRRGSSCARCDFNLISYAPKSPKFQVWEDGELGQ